MGKAAVWLPIRLYTRHCNGRDWAAQNRLVEDLLKDAALKLEDPNYCIPIFYGEYALQHFEDVWAKMMNGLNALHVSWANWNYKVSGGRFQKSGGYWRLYDSNANANPIINKVVVQEYHE